MQKVLMDSKRRTHGVWGLFVAASTVCALSWIAAAAPDVTMAQADTELNSDAGKPLIATVQSNSAACVQCHRFEAGDSHPVNVWPTMAVPAGLPLENGRMTCVTCHEATASHSSPRLAPSEKHVGIRGADATTLCLQCHQGASAGTVSIHAASYGRAHPPSKNALAASMQIEGVDAESRSCMGCHDGAAASEAGSHAVRLQANDPLSDHPIGVSMRPAATTRGADFKMASPVAIDHRIRLTDGKVACSSCHNMYSQERAKLVMSNQGSALCLNCHRQ